MKFVLGYHGGGDMPESQEEIDAEMAKWGAWFESLGAAVIDAGNPFAAAVTLHPGGKTADGGGANPLTGFSVIEAADMDDALSKAKGCPVLDGGGNIEVCQAVDM